MITEQWTILLWKGIFMLLCSFYVLNLTNWLNHVTVLEIFFSNVINSVEANHVYSGKTLWPIASQTFRRLKLCMSDFSLLIHCLPIEQRITNTTMLKLWHKRWTGKGLLIHFLLHFLVINTMEVWPGYHQLPKMKSLGLWLSILWVVALTRPASAEGELETGSEREKRKITNFLLVYF